MTNLQRIRKERGLTQAELAKLSGVSLRMIQKYETGEKNINHAQALTVAKLHFALNVLDWELLDLDKEDEQKIDEIITYHLIKKKAQNGTN